MNHRICDLDVTKEWLRLAGVLPGQASFLQASAPNIRKPAKGGLFPFDLRSANDDRDSCPPLRDIF
ncbi:MAG: hypothetical protein KME55_39240 [Nostoc indistinguendum CM1-VF10]|jgi:hypothetical protein|nr:hypothetical protein [Nostoc indistinguendum CM1-VF10]